MMVFLIAHAKVEKFEDPEAPACDRYSPRLHKHAAALVTEWCDAVLFATRRFTTRSEDAGFGRQRAIAAPIGAGGGERMLRTVSPGLYYQMVGRGFRLHPEKQDCLVLDFGGNVMRHGPIDQIKVAERGGGTGPAPSKECPECRSIVAAGYAKCPDCGYQFPPPDRTKHDAKASGAGILSGQVTTTPFAVNEVYFSVHLKRGAPEDAPRTMRVDYQVGWRDYKSEWICFEHTGYARRKAVAWWKQRSPDPVPETAERAVEIAQAGGVASTKAITVRAVAGDPRTFIEVRFIEVQGRAGVGVGDEPLNDYPVIRIRGTS